MNVVPNQPSVNLSVCQRHFDFLILSSILANLGSTAQLLSVNKMEMLSSLFLEDLFSNQEFELLTFSEDSILIDLQAKENVSLDNTMAYSDKTKKTWPIQPTRYMSTAFRLGDTGE